jgi:hypothetical protein
MGTISKTAANIVVGIYVLNAILGCMWIYLLIARLGGE